MWMTTVQEGGQTYTVAFRGGEIPNAGAPLVDNPRHPTVVEDTQRTLRVLKELDPPDLFGFLTEPYRERRRANDVS